MNTLIFSMDILLHFLYFAVSACVIWFFSGLLVDSVDRVAKRFHKSGFTVAFFVLGFMTSISELSVMVNSTLNGAPQVSAGNLPGASLVILLLIVPLLAILGNGVQLINSFQKHHFAITLAIIALPALFLADGVVSIFEGIFCVLMYLILVYFIRSAKTGDVPELVEEVEKELLQKKHATRKDILTIVGGALAIFLAGHILVEESVYLSVAFSIPSSIIGLLILSIGTNVPEIVIAVRSFKKNHLDIAFGDYMGSAVTNTLIFGVLSIMNGNFSVEATEFQYTFFFMLISFTILFLFAKSQNKLTRKEGSIILGLYVLFVLIQSVNLVRFAMT